MKRYMIILLSLCLIAACSEDDSGQVDTSVQIRLRNTSAFEYTDVYVSTGGGEFNYGDVSPNTTTPYQPYASAYSYAYVRLKIDGVEYKIQPIDYVGESLLKKGIYTYEITAKPDGQAWEQLTMSLVKD